MSVEFANSPEVPAAPSPAFASTLPNPREPRVLLEHVRWQRYEMLLADLCQQHVRLTFDRGKLEIMAPSFRHEDCSVLLAQLIRVLAQEFRLPFKSARTTTFRRPEAQRGLEVDDCFYFLNLPRVLGKREIDLAVDPPPDLALEIELSPSALDRLAIYAALRVPEVWRCTDAAIRIFRLRPEDTYEERADSPTFPGVPPTMLINFLQQGLTMDETSLLELFRAWVRREVLSQGRQPGKT
jgi:Uma2 family endonuclease